MWFPARNHNASVKNITSANFAPMFVVCKSSPSFQLLMLIFDRYARSGQSAGVCWYSCLPLLLLTMSSESCAVAMTLQMRWYQQPIFVVEVEKIIAFFFSALKSHFFTAVCFLRQPFCPTQAEGTEKRLVGCWLQLPKIPWDCFRTACKSMYVSDQ